MCFIKQLSLSISAVSPRGRVGSFGFSEYAHPDLRASYYYQEWLLAAFSCASFVKRGKKNDSNVRKNMQDLRLLKKTKQVSIVSESGAVSTEGVMQACPPGISSHGFGITDRII